MNDTNTLVAELNKNIELGTVAYQANDMAALEQCMRTMDSILKRAEGQNVCFSDIAKGRMVFEVWNGVLYRKFGNVALGNEHFKNAAEMARRCCGELLWENVESFDANHKLYICALCLTEYLFVKLNFNGIDEIGSEAEYIMELLSHLKHIVILENATLADEVAALYLRLSYIFQQIGNVKGIMEADDNAAKLYNMLHEKYLENEFWLKGLRVRLISSARMVFSPQFNKKAFMALSAEVGLLENNSRLSQVEKAVVQSLRATVMYIQVSMASSAASNKELINSFSAIRTIITNCMDFFSNSAAAKGSLAQTCETEANRIYGMLIACCTALGALYFNEYNSAEAIAAYEDTLKLIGDERYRDSLPFIETTQADISARVRLGLIYNMLKDSKSAEFYLSGAIEKSDSFIERFGGEAAYRSAAECMYISSDFYLTCKNYDKAEELSQKGIDYCKKIIVFAGSDAEIEELKGLLERVNKKAAKKAKGFLGIFG